MQNDIQSNNDCSQTFLHHDGLPEVHSIFLSGREEKTNKKMGAQNRDDGSRQVDQQEITQLVIWDFFPGVWPHMTFSLESNLASSLGKV